VGVAHRGHARITDQLANLGNVRKLLAGHIARDVAHMHSGQGTWLFGHKVAVGKQASGRRALVARAGLRSAASDMSFAVGAQVTPTPA
jgi:hypothetical protein